MPFAYVVSHVEVTDPEAFEKYRSQVPQVTEGFGGRYLARGGNQMGLEGPAPLGDRTVIIRFGSYQRAVEWYNSNEYGQLIKLRKAGSNAALMVVEGIE